MTNGNTIIVHQENFFRPKNFRYESLYRKPQNGDFIIKVPDLSFNEESYANFEEYGRTLHDDEGLNYGYVEITRIKCKCSKRKPLYHGLPDTYKYCYIVNLYLYSTNGEYITYDLDSDDLPFLLKTIIPYLNLLLKENHSVSEINFDWVKWQCTTWKSCQANGQGRAFSLKRNDFCSLEKLYDYIDTINITGSFNSIYRRGGGYKYTELKITYANIDRYVNLLIGKALGSKLIQEENEISYEVETDKKDFEGHCQTYHIQIDDIKLNEYKREILKIIRIYVLRNFDFTEMRKLRFLKS